MYFIRARPYKATIKLCKIFEKGHNVSWWSAQTTNVITTLSYALSNSMFDKAPTFFCDFPSVFRSTMPQLCPNYAPTMPQLCPAQLCPNYAPTMPFAPTMPQLCPEFCPNYAPTMPQLCPNFVSVDYWLAMLSRNPCYHKNSEHLKNTKFRIFIIKNFCWIFKFSQPSKI